MEMSTNPWTRWFFNDWMRELTLHKCGMGAQGLWMSMLCLMAVSPRYGYLEMSLSELARATGQHKAMVSRWVHELEVAGVFDRDADGVIFSRRMSREATESYPSLPADNIEQSPTEPEKATHRYPSLPLATQSYGSELPPVASYPQASGLSNEPNGVDREDSRARPRSTSPLLLKNPKRKIKIKEKGSRGVANASAPPANPSPSGNPRNGASHQAEPRGGLGPEEGTWRTRLAWYLENPASWNGNWGPPPSDSRCWLRITPDCVQYQPLLAELGFIPEAPP